MNDSVARACSYNSESNLPAARSGQVEGYLDQLIYEAGKVYLTGWACQIGVQKEIDIHIYAQGPAGDGVYLTAARTNIPSESAINQVCQTNGNLKHRFKIDLTNFVKSNAGERLYIHGIHHEGKNYTLRVSGRCAVP